MSEKDWTIVKGYWLAQLNDEPQFKSEVLNLMEHHMKHKYGDNVQCTFKYNDEPEGCRIDVMVNESNS